MKTKIVILLVLFHLPAAVRSQSQFLEKGEHGVVIGGSSTFNKAYVMLQGLASYSLAARLDLGLSYGITTFGWQKKGNVVSPAISYLVFRAEDARWFTALHAAYTYETLHHTDKDQQAKGFTYGLFYGLLLNSSHSFDVLPTLGLLFQNSTITTLHYPHIGEAGYTVVEKSNGATPIMQAGLSIVIPIYNRNALVVEFAYANREGEHEGGLSLSYLFSFRPM